MRVLAALVAMGIVIAGCDRVEDLGGLQPDTSSKPDPAPMLRVDLTDTPTLEASSVMKGPPPALDALYVTIDEVDIRLVRAGSDQAEWITISMAAVTLDLLLLQDVFTSLGVADELPEGRVTSVRLIVSEAHAVVEGVTVDVKVPSGPQTGLKIDVSFMLVEGASARVVLDFDARESVIDAPGQGLLLKPVLDVLEVTSPVTADGGVLSTQGGVRLIIPEGAVGSTPILVTLRNLAAVDLDAALAAPLPAAQYDFLGGVQLGVTKLDGSPVEFRKIADLEVDNTTNLTRNDEIPLASLVSDITGDGKRDLVLVDTAYALGAVVRTARNGFMRGIRATGVFAILSSQTGLSYVHGTTRGTLGGEGVVATITDGSTRHPIAAVSDGKGRYVLPVPFPAPAGTTLTLRDPLVDLSTVTVLDMTNASSGSFIETTPDDPGTEGPIDIDVVNLGPTELAQHWGDPPLDPINVMSPGATRRTFFVAAKQHGVGMDGAVAMIHFPNSCIPAVAVKTKLTIVNGNVAYLLQTPAPATYPKGWSLNSAAQPFVRVSIRTYGVDEQANELVSTGPTSFDIPLAVESFNPDIDNDGLANELEVFETGTDPFEVDSDGDGFDDPEEVNTGRDGFDLAAAGAVGYKKDIFVEIDWMTATNPLGIGDHTHKPGPTAREKIREAFAAECIQVHLDVGQAPYFGGNQVPHRRKFLGDCDEDPNLSLEREVMNAVSAMRAIHSNPNRNRVFHYGVMAHWACSEGSFGGLGEVGPGPQAKNFIVTLGFTPFALTAAQESAQIGETLMHELGHNLSLKHGGDTNCPNYVPNYNSLMNYRFSVRGSSNLHLGGGVELGTLHGGIDVNCDAVGDGVYDYSRGDLFNLDETRLNERVGICGNRAIDWNENGQLETTVSANLTPASSNCPTDADLTLLQDHDDWANLAHFTGYSSGFAAPEIVTCLE